MISSWRERVSELWSSKPKTPDANILDALIDATDGVFPEGQDYILHWSYDLNDNRQLVLTTRIDYNYRLIQRKLKTKSLITMLLKESKTI